MDITTQFWISPELLKRLDDEEAHHISLVKTKYIIDIYIDGEREVVGLNHKSLIDNIKIEES